MRKKENDPTFELTDEIPAPSRGVPSYRKYPFHEMDVGHSFFLPCSGFEDIQKARSSAAHFARRSGVKFVTRKMTEDGQFGVRIWRVE